MSNANGRQAAVCLTCYTDNAACRPARMSRTQKECQSEPRVKLRLLVSKLPQRHAHLHDLTHLPCIECIQLTQLTSTLTCLQTTNFRYTFTRNGYFTCQFMVDMICYTSLLLQALSLSSLSLSPLLTPLLLPLHDLKL
jgi:hypothetical protein